MLTLGYRTQGDLANAIGVSRSAGGPWRGGRGAAPAVAAARRPGAGRPRQCDRRQPVGGEPVAGGQGRRAAAGRDAAEDADRRPPPRLLIRPREMFTPRWTGGGGAPKLGVTAPDSGRAQAG